MGAELSTDTHSLCKGNVAVTQEVLDNLHSVDDYGWSVLMQAAERNNSALVEKLLAAGANPNVESTRAWGMFSEGSNALQIARVAQSHLGVDRQSVIELLQSEEEKAKKKEGEWRAPTDVRMIPSTLA